MGERVEGFDRLKWPSFKHCNREDLINIIKRLACRTVFGNPPAVVEMIMVDVNSTKALKKLDEADKWSDAAHDSRMKAFELMKPYEGKKLGEIPNDVLEAIAGHMEAAETADAKYDKLMKEIDNYGKRV